MDKTAVIKPLQLVIAWQNLPVYAAYQLRGCRERLGVFPIVATCNENVRKEVMTVLGSEEVYWIPHQKKCSWNELGIPTPKVFFHSGWRYPHFTSLADEVRQSGGSVVGMFDNCLKPTLRQTMGKLIFRFHLRKLYQAVFVPGKSATTLMRQSGFRNHCIFQGLYACDPSIFTPGSTLELRPKRFIFVGQMISRKAVDVLADAFAEFWRLNQDWELHIYGEGPLKSRLLSLPGVRSYGFAENDQIAAAMRKARFLILPSKEEHWGLVVHEAASSGCGLLLSRFVGAAADLLGSHNGLSFDPSEPDNLLQAMCQAVDWDTHQLEAVHLESRRLAEAFSPEKFSKVIERVLATI